MFWDHNSNTVCSTGHRAFKVWNLCNVAGKIKWNCGLNVIDYWYLGNCCVKWMLYLSITVCIVLYIWKWKPGSAYILWPLPNKSDCVRILHPKQQRNTTVICDVDHPLPCHFHVLSHFQQGLHSMFEEKNRHDCYKLNPKSKPRPRSGVGGLDVRRFLTRPK